MSEPITTPGLAGDCGERAPVFENRCTLQRGHDGAHQDPDAGLKWDRPDAPVTAGATVTERTVRVRADLPPIHPLHPDSERCPFRHWLRGHENAHLTPEEVAVCERTWPERTQTMTETQDREAVERAARAAIRRGRVYQDGLTPDQQVERAWADEQIRESALADMDAALSAAGWDEMRAEVERWRAERDGAQRALSEHRCSEQAERSYRRAVSAEQQVAGLQADRRAVIAALGPHLRITDDLAGAVTRLAALAEPGGQPGEEHRPRDWFTPGVWPSCSCGFAPQDNRALNAHWAERGVRYVDDRGTVKARPAPVVPDTFREMYAERTGFPAHDLPLNPGLTVVPDSAGLREPSDAELVDLYWRTTGDDWAIPDDVMVRFARAVLADVRPTVTAEQAWSEGYGAATHDLRRQAAYHATLGMSGERPMPIRNPYRPPSTTTEGA